MAGWLVLGPVLFGAFEVPERILFGGAQRLAVHALPGGRRVVDAMGAEEAPIIWGGVFSGPDAAERVRVLQELRRGGAVLPLAWEGWRFTVMIERLEVATANPAWMPYAIRLLVVSADEAVGAEAAPAAGTLAESQALGAVGDVDGAIAGASALLAGDDVAASIAASGVLARLVAGRAFLAAAGA